MGRSGGSGGRSSGGSGGGSRSSGGRSGGIGSSHRSGGGGSWGSFGSSGGSSGSRLFGSGTRMSSGGTPGGGNHDGGSGGPVGCGCGFIIILLIVLILVLIIGAFVASVITGPAEVTKSTINRQPLPAGSVNETEYYRDELGWIKNQTKMEEGLKYFYQKTGVQPYVVIIDNINGSYHPTESELDSYANALYDQLFTDEAHLLFVFYEYNDFYMDRYVAGTQAKTVIDREAADILLDYIDRNYYDSNLTDEEFFSNAFRDAADRIMTVTRSPWIAAMTTIGIVFAVVILAILLFVWWRHAKKQKNLEDKRTAEILSTPLEKFDDVEIEDLAKKYQDNPSDQDKN
ncbi:TPM domain-containing protein [Acetobacterium wieringae]|jgi:uncharacterized membrane protein|uniref:TPM domain-containing protein n=1 Tax=Acetobacterium wieringae TaxID=52694 RepID=A0A1F2PIS0_9FIRM|nr:MULTISPECIES: TPM domain-containing protein [Acetobacterium]HAZ06557.1 TPM domain-containing protein [Acetobacterium sp.]OFV70621.1 hypothetical protein ACWI_18330 [Acetobacterium wieringae]TYC88286.1 TPM domain-containing protein [Acetobacterium wieringae]UYO61469.1 TPM domain-containing protein [Acetobacterium wieringae]VUZ28571.1 Uncharacterised protein [Acetobacterium wieringae]